MTFLQSEFYKFNDKIRLGWKDEQAILRERRDVILDRLRERFSGPSFASFNQGSYEIGTGVRPIDGDYDIDVGLRLNATVNEWPDPVELKERIASALSGYNVEIRRPCVTVRYQRRGEPLYHIDINVYLPDPNDEKMLYLGVGKVGDVYDLKFWKHTDPLALSAMIDQQFPRADDREQFRRVVRYLKRWKDIHFSSEGVSAPTGVALTTAALGRFVAARETDPVSKKIHFIDLRALTCLVDAMVRDAKPRLVARFPAPPSDDLFARMNDEQMKQFVAKLAELSELLNRALSDTDDASTSAIMRRALGDGFPEVEPSKSRRRAGGAVVSSGAAG